MAEGDVQKFSAVVAFVCMFFPFVDLGSDGYLMYGYYQDYQFYKRHDEAFNDWRLTKITNETKWNTTHYNHSDHDVLLWQTELMQKYNLSSHCMQTYLCHYAPQTETHTSPDSRKDQCKFQLKKMFGRDPPEYLLGKERSFRFFLMTIVWIILGAICQTSIAINLCRYDEHFQQIPPKVRYTIALSCLFLLGPVVINIFILTECLKGVSDEKVKHYKRLLGRLVYGEVLFEALPQFVTNALSLRLKCGYKVGGNIVIWANVYSSMAFVKILSTVTSAITISYGATSVMQRAKYSVSPDRHPWASYVSIFCWILFTLGSLFCNQLLLPLSSVIHINNLPMGKTMKKMMSQLTISHRPSVFEFILPFFIIFNFGLVMRQVLTPPHNKLQFFIRIPAEKRKSFIVGYLVLFAVMFGTVQPVIIYITDNLEFRMWRIVGYEMIVILRLVFASLVIHPETGAKFFEPIVKFLLKLLDKITCTCCCKCCKVAIKEFIDESGEHLSDDHLLDIDSVPSISCPCLWNAEFLCKSRNLGIQADESIENNLLMHSDKEIITQEPGKEVVDCQVNDSLVSLSQDEVPRKPGTQSVRNNDEVAMFVKVKDTPL